MCRLSHDCLCMFIVNTFHKLCPTFKVYRYTPYIFSVIFTMGDNFHEFRFASYDEEPSKIASTVKILKIGTP